MGGNPTNTLNEIGVLVEPNVVKGGQGSRHTKLPQRGQTGQGDGYRGHISKTTEISPNEPKSTSFALVKNDFTERKKSDRGKRIGGGG